MPDKYRGKADDKRYTGDQLDVTFNLNRCVHAAECGRRLPAVFDVAQRPWVQPNAADAAEIVAAVAHCPSGALQIERKDGGSEESVPATNVIYVHENGYLRIRGDLRVSGTQIDLQDETRLTLCRCGASNQKPFCDNSHRKIEFKSEPVKIQPEQDGLKNGDKLQIQVYPNGPIGVEGNFEIRDQAGQLIFQAENKQVLLCRCGVSKAKPFCDQTHREIGFEAE